MKEYNIVMCGVGGQGTVLASKIIAQTAIRNNMNARVGETHGMSQRGGTVISHVRIGSEVYGALIPEAQGDCMLAFEPVESLRYMNYVKKDAFVIVNEHPIVPTSVNAGLATYPRFEEVKKELQRVTNNIVSVDASRIASDAGGIISLNMVILGMFSQIPNCPFPQEELKKSIEELVKPKFIQLNLNAFDQGVKVNH
ncbi:MAG TPA: indolepyruvate ferredoxin oxidoreductase subunit beta [Caldisericia bacterium]|jgi:indolepyruvate ferredoxin oxidoreductase beta subunit|nr:indolepyruvate ferredoxin oxidoreductase subunit beta [Caldisericia bacterium]HXK51399.1 indolepyruvate ferredoxin oxidoreductase subunit beta [Caldisericia bacterium]